MQPVLGRLHHSQYTRLGKRTSLAPSHVWLGRGLLLLGVINGGLGLQLANNTKKGEIAYGVVAGVFFLLYIAVVVVFSRRSKETLAQGAGQPAGPSAVGREKVTA